MMQPVIKAEGITLSIMFRFRINEWTFIELGVPQGAVVRPVNSIDWLIGGNSSSMMFGRRCLSPGGMCWDNIILPSSMNEAAYREKVAMAKSSLPNLEHRNMLD